MLAKEDALESVGVIHLLLDGSVLLMGIEAYMRIYVQADGFTPVQTYMHICIHPSVGQS